MLCCWLSFGRLFAIYGLRCTLHFLVDQTTVVVKGGKKAGDQAGDEVCDILQISDIDEPGNRKSCRLRLMKEELFHMCLTLKI